jgi:hypothetical protein
MVEVQKFGTRHLGQERQKRNLIRREQRCEPESSFFFCGCGGLNLGFRGDYVYRDEHYRKLPFEINAAYDNNAQCIETYNRYSAKQYKLI